MNIELYGRFTTATIANPHLSAQIEPQQDEV